MTEYVAPKSKILRWGLLGTGGIARKFAQDLGSQGIDVRSVASRDGDRASLFAADLGIPQSHASYQELLENPDVDAIYIALPNHMHADWSIRAARAGKHVLCEKPAALDEAECESVLNAVAKAGVFYMEGFMYRCHPMWGMVKALIEDGHIGEVRSLRASFCFDMGLKPENIRQRREVAGGALTDVGCYCLSFARMISKAEPGRVSAVSFIGETGVDDRTSAELVFPDGTTASFECALRDARPHAAVIQGDSGRLEISAPWHPPADNAEVILYSAVGDAECYRTGDGLPLFAREALDVSENLHLRQSPSMTWEDSLGQARALERLRKSAGHI
ncbi:MAG: Gfo/Idh/MocA family oxidoreductase [Fibrobacterota bacterium]|nr:Gfo/Idh/MocA family oxidoreductase [Fibrobacterota bacterium]